MIEIVLGTYKHWMDGNTRTTQSCYPGTIEWDRLIRDNCLEGVELELVLRPKNKPQGTGRHCPHH